MVIIFDKWIAQKTALWNFNGYGGRIAELVDFEHIASIVYVIENRVGVVVKQELVRNAIFVGSLSSMKVKNR